MVDFARICGATIGQQSGEAVSVEFPDWLSVLDWCAYASLDAAERCPAVVSLGLNVAGESRDPAPALLGWLQANIEWRDEPGERLSYPGSTLARGWGDCDDSAMLLASLLNVVGIHAVPVGITLDGGPVHCVTAMRDAGQWWWLDPSEPGCVEPWKVHPLQRDARPGVRGIIAPRVVDVAPWPPLPVALIGLTRDAVSMPEETTQQNDTAGVQLVAGAWYAAALNTGAFPRALVETQLREVLTLPEAKFGSLQIYWSSLADW